MRVLSVCFCLYGLFVLGCRDTVVAPRSDIEMRTVNVVFSVDRASLNGPVASQQYSIPDITRRVVRTGAVLAYYREQDTWTALPYTVGRESADVNAVDYTFTIGYGYDTGFFEVFIEASTSDPAVWQQIANSLPRSYEVRLVILENGLQSGLDATNYNAIMSHYEQLGSF